MALLVILALIGAVLGATLRPRLIAAPVAIAIAGVARALIGVAAPGAIDNIGAPFWSQWSLAITLEPLDGYGPLLTVSGFAACIAAVLAMLTDRRAPRPATLDEATQLRRRIRKGRYVRTPNMIQERPAQLEAEQRQRSLLGL